MANPHQFRTTAQIRKRRFAIAAWLTVVPIAFAAHTFVNYFQRSQTEAWSSRIPVYAIVTDRQDRGYRVRTRRSRRSFDDYQIAYTYAFAGTEHTNEIVLSLRSDRVPEIGDTYVVYVDPNDAEGAAPEAAFRESVQQTRVWTVLAALISPALLYGALCRRFARELESCIPPELARQDAWFTPNPSFSIFADSEALVFGNVRRSRKAQQMFCSGAGGSEMYPFLCDAKRIPYSQILEIADYDDRSWIEVVGAESKDRLYFLNVATKHHAVTQLRARLPFAFESTSDTVSVSATIAKPAISCAILLITLISRPPFVWVVFVIVLMLILLALAVRDVARRQAVTRWRAPKFHRLDSLR